MRELSDAMHEALEQRNQALRDVTLDAAALRGLRSRVRRRRVLRHTAEAAVAVPVAAALALGGYWLVAETPEPTPPVETPVVTPTPTPEPTPELTPDPEPTSSAAPETDLGEPVSRAGFPTYYELPEGILDEAGPGWVVATLVPRTIDVGASSHTEEGVFLIRPDGTRFLLHWLPTALDVDEETAEWNQRDVVSWDPDARTVLLHETRHWETYAGESAGIEGSSGSADGPILQLDLVTGETTTHVEEPQVPASFVGVTADGRFLWHSLRTFYEDEQPVLVVAGPEGERLVDTQHPSDGFHAVSPDGRAVLLGGGAQMFEVVDVDSEEVVGGGPLDEAFSSCAAVGWWTEDEVLGLCVVAGGGDAEESSRLVTFDHDQLATGRGTVLEPQAGSDEVRFTYAGAYLSDRSVVIPGSDPTREDAYCHAGAYLVGPTSLSRVVDVTTEVDGAFVTPAVVGSSVYVRTSPCWSQDRRAELLVVHDLSSGRTTRLVDPPVEPDVYMTTVRFAVAR